MRNFCRFEVEIVSQGEVLDLPDHQRWHETVEAASREARRICDRSPQPASASVFGPGKYRRGFML